VKLYRSIFVLGTLSALYAASSCSGDDGKKKQLPAADAGGQAGSGGASSGGSSSGKGGKGGGGGRGGTGGQPQGGGAGEAPGGASGEGGVSGEAGMGGVAIGGEGGAGGACGGTDTTSTCFTMQQWNPRFDAATGEFRFDVSSLNAEIVSGSATCYEWTQDIDSWLLNGCATLENESFAVEGSDVVFSIGGNVSAADRVTINYLSLTDSCGNVHTLMLSSGAPCFWIQFTPASDASTLWQMGCGSDGIDCGPACV